ncbi:MAG: bifunctional adenosylcobinamide kinase/adenosylcobinamide-phosphate guanylyltransferase [Spirochaetales bacterium]|nr:bifunctional adenosylcobinamide kinase/adenosylcobinamide-phosphate guanylyltransferase [Spirochaetales bacterium]
MGKIILVLGGTKSGKTSFAQNEASKLARLTGKNISYIATARALDQGMKDRIKRHKESRPNKWETWEEPLNVSEILTKAAMNKAAAILDCFTMLATNIIMELGENPERIAAMDAVSRETNAVISAAKGVNSTLFIISNHVEVGLIAPTALGGLFQDIAGINHQMLAREADEVYLLTAGIPQRLK